MIQIKNLYLKFIKEYYALYNINLSVNAGDVVELIGSENSGRTTLLRTIAKLEKFDKGEIYLRDINIKKVNFKDDISLGYLPSKPILLENESVYENLKYILKNRRFTEKEIEDKIDDALENFNLSLLKQTSAKDLSLFQKYMVSFARLSLRELDIALVDNLLENLTDEKEIEIIKELIFQMFVKKGVTTLLVANEKQTYQNIANKFVYFNNGAIDKIEEAK